jgi:serine/threonine-protein kinase
MAEPEKQRNPVEELAESFLRRYRQGEQPSITEYVAKHPELAWEIRDLFPALVVMEEVGAEESDPATAESASDGRQPEQIGGYRIIREISRGGMGIVYEAQQESLGRHVALKVLPHLVSGDATRLLRFRREARSAARLHHTNIAPVFEVGESHGIHYYAMQFIDGQALDSVLRELRRLRAASALFSPESETPWSGQEFLERQELSQHLARSLRSGLSIGEGGPTEESRDSPPSDIETKKTLAPESDLAGGAPMSSDGSPGGGQGPTSDLLSKSDSQYFHSVARVGLQVAEALAYAHRQKVLHRDIKPSNLLLDFHGTVWVTDFGLAKEDGDDLTRTGDIVGTLSYMAPERLSGLSDARSDIYSLGLTLYELLTLQPAFRESDRYRLIMRVTHEEPPRPTKLDPQVPRDLETIVLKAIAKEPARRYANAEALAEDLRRFLSDRPIQARRASIRERSWRWCRRNPVVASMSVVLIVMGLLICIGSVFAALHLGRAADDARRAREREAEQRIKAEKARDRARQALDDMTSSVTGDSLSTQKEISTDQKKFLTEVLKYYNEFAGEKADDEISRGRTAAAALRVGKIEERLGRTEQAVVAFQMARDGYAKLAADAPAVPEYRQELANSHHYLGNVLRDLGKRAPAEEQYRQALAIRQKLAAEFPAVPAYRQKLAGSHNNLGMLLADPGKAPEAQKQYRNALAIEEKLAAEFPAVPEYRQYLANSHNNLGLLLADLGKGSEAQEHYRQAVAIKVKLTAEFPTVPQYRQELALGHNNLGIVLAHLGKQAEAEEQYRQGLAVQEKLAADFPAMPKYQVDLGGSYCNLGILVSDGGRPGASLDWFEKAIRILTGVYEQDRRLVKAGRFLRNSYWRRARAYDRLQKYAEGLKDYDRAIELSPKEEQQSYRAMRALVRVNAGQIGEAVAEVEELTKSSDPNAKAWYNCACVYATASAKAVEKKQAYADRAMELLVKTVKAGHTDAARMKKDTDLDSLRGRDDFKKLLAELTSSKEGVNP